MHIQFDSLRVMFIGRALCYYQWFSGRSYSDIFKVLSYEDLANMYHTLHEADITKFVDIADEKIRAHLSQSSEIHSFSETA